MVLKKRRASIDERRTKILDERPRAVIGQREITVTLSKTIQIRQFEPVVVTLTDRAVIDDGSNDSAVKATRGDMYNQLSKSLKSMMNHQIQEWTDDDD